MPKPTRKPRKQMASRARNEAAPVEEIEEQVDADQQQQQAEQDVQPVEAAPEIDGGESDEEEAAGEW